MLLYQGARQLQTDPLRTRIEREITAIDKELKNERLAYQHDELKAQRRVLLQMLGEKIY